MQTLKEALYTHILLNPKFTGITGSELFADDRPMDMAELENKERKIHIIIEKISGTQGSVDNQKEIYNFHILGIQGILETEKKMELCKELLKKEFNGVWGYLNNGDPNVTGFRICGSNFIIDNEDIDYNTNEKIITLRFEFFYQKKLDSGISLYP